MDKDMFWHLQPHGSKIPDRLDARLHHLIRNFLSHFSWAGDDADVDTHPLGKGSHLYYRQDHSTVHTLAYPGGIGIECRQDTQAESSESLVTEKCRTKISHSNKNSLVDMIPTQECFNGVNEFLDGVTSLWLAGDSCILQIFADLNRNAIQVPPDHTAGDLGHSPGTEFHQIMVIVGQPS